VHAQAAQRGQRQHGGSPFRIGLDQQVPALVVVERQFGQADHEVPVLLARPALKPVHGGVDILGASRERLAHDRDVPGVAAVGRPEIAQPPGDLGRGGRISDETDAKGVHENRVPIESRDTRRGDGFAGTPLGTHRRPQCGASPPLIPYFRREF
jgi:hypothetical protein